MVGSIPMRFRHLSGNTAPMTITARPVLRPLAWCVAMLPATPALADGTGAVGEHLPTWITVVLVFVGAILATIVVAGLWRWRRAIHSLRDEPNRDPESASLPHATARIKDRDSP